MNLSILRSITQTFDLSNGLLGDHTRINSRHKRAKWCPDWPENPFIFHSVRQEHQKMAQNCLVSLTVIKLHQIHPKWTTPHAPRMWFKVKNGQKLAILSKNGQKSPINSLFFHTKSPKTHNFECSKRVLLKVTVLNHFHSI